VKHHYVRSGDDRQVDGETSGARIWEGLGGMERSEETKNEEKKKKGAPPGRDIRHLRGVANNTEDTQLGGKLGPTRPPDKLPKN